MSDQYIITGDNGEPVAAVDLDKLQSDATRLMYALAATAGDDQATDQVALRWSSTLDPDYFGYVAAGALSLLVRHVLGPTLDVTDQLGVDLRRGLRDAAANAEANLG